MVADFGLRHPEVIQKSAGPLSANDRQNGLSDSPPGATLCIFKVW